MIVSNCSILPPYPQLQQQGILKSDDLITRFFRISVEMCVDLCYRTLNDPVSVSYRFLVSTSQMFESAKQSILSKFIPSYLMLMHLYS